MDQNYIAPAAALKKLKTARSLPQTVYLYGAAGYGKTEPVRQYLSGRRYAYLSCEELPWEDGALSPAEAGWQNRRIVVIDDLHRLKSEELRREILALEERENIWLILVSRSPIPAQLMPRYVKDGFILISEDDLRMGRKEIAAYLDACGIAYSEEDMRLLEVTDEGNAYVLHHAALRIKEGLSPGLELHAEIWDTFAVYLENVVLVRWDSDLLEFLMQVSVVDEFTLKLAEMISGNLHVTALPEQAAEAGNFLTQEDGVYRLRPVLIQALRNWALKVYGRERVKDFKYNAALYYEMHDEVVPALKLFEECGKTERIKNLLIRNAWLNAGIGHYYELRRYYLNLDEREITDSPVLMADMSMLYSMLMDGEKSEYWYQKLKAYAAGAKGGVRGVGPEPSQLSGHRPAPPGEPGRAGGDEEHPRPAVRQGQPLPGAFRHQQPAQHHERRQGLLPLEPRRHHAGENRGAATEKGWSRPRWARACTKRARTATR